MKIVAISDTHDLHKEITIPECDVLIVAGDFTCHRVPIVYYYEDFNAWLGSVPAKHKIVVAGNHDTYFERYPNEARELLTNATYLQDSGIEIDGVKFWGSPWTPYFNAWAFMEPDPFLKKYWDKIPKDTDVLVTHGPPFGILDSFDNNNVGSFSLLNKVTELDDLKLHFFGHIHESYGKEGKFYNVAQCDGDYNITNKPVMVEFNKDA